MSFFSYGTFLIIPCISSMELKSNKIRLKVDLSKLRGKSVSHRKKLRGVFLHSLSLVFAGK